MERYDLIVIGAGPGGYVAAIKAAQLGLHVALVEQGEVGGCCLNRGCIPTKTILHTAELFAELAHGAAIGLVVEGARIDYGILRSRTAAVVGQLRRGIEDLLQANGVDLIAGTASVQSAQSVRVASEQGTRELVAGALILAAGSAPSLPPLPGIGLPNVYTSDTILTEIPEIKRLAIIGGSVIGMEFASLYAPLGSEITVLEAMPRILPAMDREFSQSLAQVMKQRGCTIHTKTQVDALEQGAGGSLLVRFTAKDGSRAIEVDGVLVATGRSANTRALFAGGFSVEMDRGRIVVDGRAKTSEAHVYAIGDITTNPIQLAHAASAQGIMAACDIAGIPCGIDPALIPTCVYSSPEIASVGLTETEAKEAGIAVQVGKYPMSNNSKTLITGQDRSYLKIIADGEGTVIGAQLMCGRATDMIGELTLAIAARCSAEQIADLVHPHPTFNEALGEAAEVLLGRAIHVMPRSGRQ